MFSFFHATNHLNDFSLLLLLFRDDDVDYFVTFRTCCVLQHVYAHSCFAVSRLTFVSTNEHTLSS